MALQPSASVRKDTGTAARRLSISPVSSSPSIAPPVLGDVVWNASADESQSESSFQDNISYDTAVQGGDTWANVFTSAEEPFFWPIVQTSITTLPSDRQYTPHDRWALQVIVMGYGVNNEGHLLLDYCFDRQAYVSKAYAKVPPDPDTRDKMLRSFLLGHSNIKDPRDFKLMGISAIQMIYLRQCLSRKFVPPQSFWFSTATPDILRRHCCQRYIRPYQESWVPFTQPSTQFTFNAAPLSVKQFICLEESIFIHSDPMSLEVVLRRLSTLVLLRPPIMGSVSYIPARYGDDIDTVRLKSNSDSGESSVDDSTSTVPLPAAILDDVQLRVPRIAVPKPRVKPPITEDTIHEFVANICEPLFEALQQDIAVVGSLLHPAIETLDQQLRSRIEESFRDLNTHIGIEIDKLHQDARVARAEHRELRSQVALLTDRVNDQHSSSFSSSPSTHTLRSSESPRLNLLAAEFVPRGPLHTPQRVPAVPVPPARSLLHPDPSVDPALVPAPTPKMSLKDEMAIKNGARFTQAQKDFRDKGYLNLPLSVPHILKFIDAASSFWQQIGVWPIWSVVLSEATRIELCNQLHSLGKQVDNDFMLQDVPFSWIKEALSSAIELHSIDDFFAIFVSFKLGLTPELLIPTNEEARFQAIGHHLILLKRVVDFLMMSLRRMHPPPVLPHMSVGHGNFLTDGLFQVLPQSQLDPLLNMLARDMTHNPSFTMCPFTSKESWDFRSLGDFLGWLHTASQVHLKDIQRTLSKIRLSQRDFTADEKNLFTKGSRGSSVHAIAPQVNVEVKDDPGPFSSDSALRAYGSTRILHKAPFQRSSPASNVRSRGSAYSPHRRPEVSFANRTPPASPMRRDTAPRRSLPVPREKFRICYNFVYDKDCHDKHCQYSHDPVVIAAYLKSRDRRKLKVSDELGSRLHHAVNNVPSHADFFSIIRQVEDAVLFDPEVPDPEYDADFDIDVDLNYRFDTPEGSYCDSDYSS